MATTSYTTVTLLSFAQWLDHWLLSNGQYVNASGQFYYQPDPSISGKVAYAAPFRSFVWDSGVAGATFINSIDGNLGPLAPGQSGLSIDYVNGRALMNEAVGTSAIISGSYSVKGFNLYFANQSQERIVFTNKYYLNSRFNRVATGIPPPRQFVTPCIFVSAPLEENEPESFGGVYNTKTSISLNILAESQQQLENAISILLDSEQRSFPQLPPSESPIGPFGDLKSGGYSYSEVSSRYDQPGNLYTIQDVQASKLSDRVKIDENIFVGLAELEVVKARTIH